jgi:CRP-like cAMP-binding protein
MISTNAPFPGMVVPVDPRTIAALLAKVAPFDGLDEVSRLAVASRSGRRVVERGQVVCWQDEPGESMFVLLEGVVKVVVRSRDGELMELVRHHPPASFGELAVLDGGPRSATVEAVERSDLLVLTRDELLRLLRSEEHVAEALLRSLGMIVRRTTNQVADLAFLSLQGRVAAKLLELAGPARHGPPRTRRVTGRSIPLPQVGHAAISPKYMDASADGKSLLRQCSGGPCGAPPRGQPIPRSPGHSTLLPSRVGCRCGRRRSGYSRGGRRGTGAQAERERLRAGAAPPTAGRRPGAGTGAARRRPGGSP